MHEKLNYKAHIKMIIHCIDEVEYVYIQTLPYLII